MKYRQTSTPAIFRQQLISSFLALAGLSLSLAGQASEHSLPLKLQGSGPVYQIALPLQVIANANQADLADLRIVNAQGQDVPWSWRHAEFSQSELKQQTVPVFAISQQAKQQAAQIKIASNGHLQLINPNAIETDQTLWLADLSQIHGQLLEANLKLPENVQGAFSLHVELSDDLQHWQSPYEAFAIVQVNQDGQQISQLNLNLQGASARYMRLRWQGQNQPGKIAELQITSSATAYSLPRLLWTPALRAEQCTPGYCDYRLPAHLSLEKLKINLAQKNSLARLDILGLQDAAAPVQMRRHINPLSWLHQHRVQAKAQAQAKEQIYQLGQTLAYQIDYAGSSLTSPEITLDGGVYRSLRLQLSAAQTDMAIALGPMAPEIQVAMSQQKLIFLARGEAPFKLLLGGKPAAQHYSEADITTPLQLATGKQAEFAEAEVDVSTLSLFTAPVAKQNLVKADQTKPVTERKLWLWGILALAIVAVAAMVISLLRKPPVTDENAV